MSGFACVKESNGVAKAVRRNGLTENGNIAVGIILLYISISLDNILRRWYNKFTTLSRVTERRTP